MYSRTPLQTSLLVRVRTICEYKTSKREVDRNPKQSIWYNLMFFLSLVVPKMVTPITLHIRWDGHVHNLEPLLFFSFYLHLLLILFGNPLDSIDQDTHPLSLLSDHFSPCTSICVSIQSTNIGKEVPYKSFKSDFWSQTFVVHSYMYFFSEEVTKPLVSKPTPHI